MQHLTLSEDERYVIRKCSRKRRIRRRKIALMFAANMTIKHGRAFNAYRCEVCGKWHVGKSAELPEVQKEVAIGAKDGLR